MNALPRYWILDPRPEEKAREHPLLGAVNLPFESRIEVSELPAPGQPIGLPIGYVSLGEIPEILLSRNPIVWVEPRFGECPRGRLWSVNPWFAAVLPSLPQGSRIIDLGAGHGREAIYTTAQGFTVEAVDHLPELKERGQTMANRYLDDDCLARIQFTCGDLRTRAAHLEPEDVVVSIRVGGEAIADAVEAALEAQRFPKLWLGVFFTQEHRERLGKSYSDHDTWEGFANRLKNRPGLSLSSQLVRNHRESVVCCQIRMRQS
ncbi:MAG: class I SAM-dependent methyltransferase [Fimbriimonadaceae bacterium]